MRLFLFFMFLTLVINTQFSYANPHQDIDPASEQKNPSSEEKLEQKRNWDDENIILSKPKPVAFSKITDDFYPYTQSISPRLGALVNLKEFKNDIGKSFNMLYGFNYLFPRNTSPQLEVGADIIKNYNGQFHVSKRWIINERSSFRPYYKLGATLIAIGKEGLATFTNTDNYLLKGSLGLEDYYKRPMSFRIELELAAGIEYFFLYITFGYSWGF